MAPGSKARELLEHISEGFIFVDADYRVREMNAEALRIGGRPLSAYLGRSLWEIRPNLIGGEFERRVRAAMADGTPFSIEHRHTWPNGREAWFETRGVPADQGLALFYRDITEQKASRDQLRRAQSELMHTERLSAMGTMAATFAHELAQPLTSASNYVETCERLLRSPTPAQVREARAGLNMAALSIGQAREMLARIRSFVAKGPIDSKPYDLRLIVADASILVLPKAQREGVEIAFDLEPRAIWVRVDALQVQQVLVNLIRNAIEAMEQMPGPRRIAIASAILSPGWIEVRVADNGPGLDPAEAQNLFHPFQSGKTEGLGVGLSISRTIVEAHGGTISAEPAPGGGALFRFTLPRTVGDA